MNNKIHYIFTYYHLGLAVRDTLEYIQAREHYPVEIYNQKVNTFKLNIKEGSALDSFCKANGENGEKLYKAMTDLYELVYGENQRFIRIDGEECVPDKNQFMKVIDLVVSCKTSLYSITMAYLNSIKGSPDEDEKATTLVEKENIYANSVMGLVISDYLFNVKFKEFNEAKRSHNGEDSVESNFATSEIQTLIGLFNFVANRSTNDDFKACVDKTTNTIKLICGEIKLQAGEKFEDHFAQTHNAWATYINKIEPEYINLHKEFWQQLVDYETEMRKQKMN